MSFPTKYEFKAMPLLEKIRVILGKPYPCDCLPARDAFNCVACDDVTLPGCPCLQVHFYSFCNTEACVEEFLWVRYEKEDRLRNGGKLLLFPPKKLKLDNLI